MANTQLVCPHCGSALTFGMEIRLGTPIECLICMQSFSAQPTEAPTPIVAKTTTPPTGIAVAQKAKPAPPPIPTSGKAKATPTPSRTPRREGSGATGKPSLILLGLGAMLLLIVGIGFGAWKLSNSASSSDLSPDSQLAANGKGETPDAAKTADANKANPLVGADADDDLRRKKEAEKKLLARKNPIKLVGSDLDFDPISSLKLPNQPIAGLDQQKINSAIDKGVIYLKKSQNANGSWHNGHDVGYAAIGGLTLLECGVPANDPAVQRAAAFVRMKAAEHRKTYELALAVLFLDRLGDPRDRPLIQWTSLRILAGQNDTGGWGYDCPLPPPQELYKLYAFLQSRRPALQNPVHAKDKMAMKDPLAAEPDPSSVPFQQFQNLILAQQTGTDGKVVPPKKGAGVPAAKGNAKTPAPINPMLLMPDLRNLPVVQNQGKKKGLQAGRNHGGDNSNTQFAMLALWAARRHGIPTDAALLYSYQRFQVSQTPEGGWAYLHNIGAPTPSMTCVGLLGEAMGHGAAPDIIGFNPKNPKEPIIRPVLDDPTIKKGFAYLATAIGEPSKDNNQKSFPRLNLYFLWSVERVAMLYDLKTINGKDWYGWGAQVLVHNQQPDGAWINGQFHGQSGPLNTCFALLFLRRSNLVQDLTNNLRLHSAIRDPG